LKMLSHYSLKSWSNTSLFLSVSSVRSVVGRSSCIRVIRLNSFHSCSNSSHCLRVLCGSDPFLLFPNPCQSVCIRGSRGLVFCSAICSYPHFCRKNTKRCVTCVTNSQDAESEYFTTSFQSISSVSPFAMGLRPPSSFACLGDASRCVTCVTPLFAVNQKLGTRNPKPRAPSADKPTVRFAILYTGNTKKALYASPRHRNRGTDRESVS